MLIYGVCVCTLLRPKKNEIMPFAATWMDLRDYNTKWSKSEEERKIPHDITYVWNLHFPDGLDGKESACNAGDWVWSLGQEDSLEKGMATHSSILVWRVPWTEEPGGLQSMESQSRTLLSSLHLHFRVWHLKCTNELIYKTETDPQA